MAPHTCSALLQLTLYSYTPLHFYIELHYISTSQLATPLHFYITTCSLQCVMYNVHYSTHAHYHYSAQHYTEMVSPLPLSLRCKIHNPSLLSHYTPISHSNAFEVMRRMRMLVLKCSKCSQAIDRKCLLQYLI